MFKRILMPTDGSALSKQAVERCIAFAGASGAELVGLHVVALPPGQQLEAWMTHAPHLVERRQAMFDKFADQYLAEISAAATAQHVPCTVIKVRSADVAASILAAAGDLGCDLIFMASHGWKGDRARVPGSETLKVLQDSKVPVLVHKAALGRA
jgi:nucleotide-binding universal stress UspA family protein